MITVDRWRRLFSGILPRANRLLSLVVAIGVVVGFGGASEVLARDTRWSGPQSVAPVAKKLINAVVNISTSRTVKGARGVPLPRVPKGSPFEEFFEDFFSSKSTGQGGRNKKVSSLGSGFVIDGKKGLIVTNFHVIKGADEIIINFHDGKKLKVTKVIGTDPKTDLALLKVDPKVPLVEVKFDASDVVEVGDWVMAIGNPFGLGGTVTVGIISAKERNIESGPYDDYLQTDAAINKGNSGGPLFNMKGQVIGVNTAIISPTGGSIGIGFAVPAETAMSVLDQLRRYGETRRGWLGVRIQSVPEDVAKSLGIEANVGAYVAKVTPGGPAEKGGIKAEDVITKFDGKAISSVRGLPRVVAKTAVGKSVEVEILRKGRKEVLKIIVGRLIEKDNAANAKSKKPDPNIKIPQVVIGGLSLKPISPELRKTYSLGKGAKGLVVTKVEPASAGAQKKITAGDVIVEVGGEPVKTPEDVMRRVDAARKAGKRAVVILVERPGGQLRTISLPFK